MSSYYERLTQLDNSFLVYEDAQPVAGMHVATTQIHEAAPLRLADGSLDIDRIEQYVLSRLGEIPRYRQRLLFTPVEGHPVWVDDPTFNLHYHVRHTRLPHPGNLRQLKRLVGRLFSQRLDRDKPLWEMWIIEGLEDDRFAILSKIHHCMVDGVSGSELISALLREHSSPHFEPAADWKPRPQPSTLELIAGEATRLAGVPSAAFSMIADLVSDENHARDHLLERGRAIVRTLSDSMEGTGLVPFNQPIGPYRRMDWTQMSIAKISEVRRAVGGSLNDVVLATAAGALRRYLTHDHGMDVSELRFRVMTPVSMHRPGDPKMVGNRVSTWLVDLPVSEPDPLVRLERIGHETTRLKETNQALGGAALAEMTEWIGPGAYAIGARLANLGTPVNTVITNVPGPRSRLYLLESPLLEIHGHVPVLGLVGMGIALFSYNGTISWSFTGDWDLVPDLHALVDATDQAFVELCEAAGVAP